nr:titin-like isoform X2 [Penaeus vannamei]
MDAAERVYTDNVLPSDAEGARQLLSQLHDHKRAILEASMYTLQEAQALLARLRGLATEGATLDSRPQHIKTNIEFACSQIEHYLESLHDRRRFLDGLFSARKHHLEQCLALCLLYQDLTEAVTSLKQLRDEVSEHQGLGESQGNAEILLHEHLRRETAAKEQQDKCIRLLKTAERMASGGHYAGLEARSRAYSVLEAATALHETCDTRTALLQQSILFFKLAQTAMTKLDQAEVQVASLGGEGAQRLSLVVGVVEEAIQPALAEGYAILEVTGGRNQPHNLGISLVVEELERRRSHLSSICVSSTEQVLQRTELSNAFLEQYNSIESWLVRIGDAFLQGHQDPGGSLSLARDFLHLHQTLNNDVMEKKREIDSLDTFLSKLLRDLSEEEAAGYQEKMQALKDHWDALKKVLDIRIAISDKYVKFHEDAEAVNNEHESLEQLLKEAHGEDIVPQVEAKWEQVQKLYLDLCNNGKAFCQDVKNVEDPYLDTNRAVLCVENILEQLGKRRLVITDLHSHFHMKITTTKEMLLLWNTYRENVVKMQSEMSSLETDFCPLLRGDPADPEDIANTLDQRLSVYVSAVKKTQEDIQNMMTRAEVMSYKGDQGGQRDEVIGALLQLYQNLQNKATEYQILGHMLIQWCRNIAEIHRSCDKLESQFGNVSLDIGGIEGQLLEHEASKQAVLELLKFAQNESTSIVTKIKEQCPPDAGAKDIGMINEMLERRGRVFETVWSHHQQMLERQLKRSQYHVDLQVISDQLRDLSEQLGRMRGHYGDSLAAAKNMQTAFTQFKITVDMLERRIQTFVSTAVKMLGQEDDSGEVQQELAELEKKWSTFQRQVGESEKSIELSIDFFKLVEEAEDWFKNGSKLLVTVAGESSNIQNPDQAQKLRKRIEHFLQPGEQAQAERITKISSLALQLYGSATPRQIEVVSHQNTHMLESFNVINRNLEMLIINLKNAEDLREKQKKEKEELAASLTAAQAEAEAARLRAAAAEEARRAAEEVARTMAIPVEPIVPEKVEIEIQTEAIPLPPEEPRKPEETPPAKKAKLIDDEPQHMPPVFMTPLVGASVSEGVKFSFECRVIGFPMPEVEWLKDNMSISGNPDYKTSFEEGICTLTIEETFTEDSALFTCKAVNAAGMAETSATLTVKEAEAVEVMAPPLFTKRLIDSAAEEGSSYQLEATVEGHPLPVVSWSKDGKCVDESPDYVITFNNGECVLRFEEVFVEDQAEYQCRASNDLGEDITKARLTVTAVELSERPKFTMLLSNVMARAGQKFKLECQVTGNPTPTITWFHNNKPVKETPDCRLTFDGQTATLVMSEAFPKNAGTYTVVAKNSAGEAQCSANVSVKGRIPTETSDSEVASDIDAEPVKPSVQLPLKDTSIQEGRPARLDCVIVGQPEPEVIWYHDDKPVKESNDFKLLFHGDRCSLIIQEAFLEDAGIYRVVAMNSAGEASTACFLNVEPVPELAPPSEPEAPTVAPRFSQLLTDSHVTEGKPITLRASVTGEPAPTIAWFKDGVPLLPDNEFQIQENRDGSLIVHINAATLDHTGQYEIVASNAAGTAKCVAYLSIEPRLPTPPPPEHREPPVFTKLIQDVTVTSGSGVIFEAEVTGVPKPTVYWTLNDCHLTGQEYLHGQLQYLIGNRGSVHSLELPTTSKLQAGIITIVAENAAGKAVSAAALKILDPPTVVAKPAAMEPQGKPQHHVREESYTSSTTSSSTMFQQTSRMETSHITKVVMSSGGSMDEKKHSMSAASTSQVKKVSGQPATEVHKAHFQEVKQDGIAPAVVSDKVSMVKIEGDKVVQQVSQDSGTVSITPPPKKFATGKRKAAPARFITPLQSIIAKEDDRIVLESTIDGYPDPSVTWTHNDGPLKDDIQVKTQLNKTSLTIPRVNQGHSGHYTCFIQNEGGSAQCTCDVIIKKKQFPPVISKRLQPVVVGVNERLHMEIDVTGTPLPEVSWTKDGQALTASDRLTQRSEGTRHLLIIQEAQLDDSGRYGAIATNPAGRAETLADVMVTQLIIDETSQTHKIVFTDVTDETKMFTSRSEEVHEERRGGAPGTKPTPETKPTKEEKKPKYEEFRRETHGHPGKSGPYSEDTYYAMKDESDISTEGRRTKKKVEMKSETHVEVMSDKKVEVFESTSVDVTPKPKKKQVVKMEQKHEVKAIQDARPAETSAPVPTSEPKVKSTPVAETKTSEKEIKISSVTECKEHLVKESFTSEKQDLPQQVIKPVKKVSLKTEPEKDVKAPLKVPKIEPLKSTGLVKQAVTIQEKEKIELDLKPFPFEPDPEKPKKPRGQPPSHPSKFKKGEFHESDYDSDYEGKIAPKWKPADSDAEENVYGKVQPPLGKSKVSQPHVRTPTPPSAFDQPPQFEGPARPKIDFPESETEPERDVSPEIVIPEKVEYVAPPEPPKVAPKEPKLFRSQPPKKEFPKKEPPKREPPPRSPSPVLQPGTPPEELYAESKPKESPFSNAIGVESTKITKIADSSAYHKRFVTMQQTTRVIKFTDSRTATTSTESQQASSSERKSRSTKREEPKREPLPALEPFPFTPDPPKPKKDRGAPPPKPKKFQKGEFTGSDYESDYESRIRPKWQPPDSDAEEPNYTKVKPQLRSDRTPSKTRERTPTPPTVFDVPPEEGPWRPSVEKVEITAEIVPSPEILIPKDVPKKEIQRKVVVKATKSTEKLPERPVSPELPPPGTPPEEGVIIQQTEYVVDKVDVKSRILPPPMQEVQTYEEKPYTKIIERTEKTFTDIKLEEEMRMKKEKMERKITTETDYEQVPERPPPPVEEEQVVVETERLMDLEPFPFTVEEPKPKKERGPPPPKPKKFYKGEFRESDYESDYEGRLKPKWKPADSDVEDPEYTPVRPPPPRERTISKSRERTPTPPSKFDVPPTLGEPLRPVIKPVDQPLVQAFKETSPEIIIPKIEEKKVSKTPKVVPKAPSIKVKQEEPEKPKVPSPPLPEPGPQPEIGYVEGGTATLVQEEEDAHIRMIKKKIEAKKGFQIDIDITDIYDFVSESELEKTDTESGKGKQFPKLEPFPYEPEPHRPKRERGPPPPQPKKFFKGEFRGSDYESDYDSRPIAPKWLPPDSEGEEPMYRRVAPPAGDPGKRRSESSGRDPSPPSKFDQPPQFEGPPRPVVELSDIPRRERRESLEEYSIPRFPKVEFKPFDLEDENRHHPHISHTTDTETEPEAFTQPLSPTKTGIDKKYAKSAQKVVSHQFEDMTQTFRHKAQKFAEQLVTEVFAAREGSVPAEPAGEPPSMPEELKKQSVSPVSTAAPPTTADGLATDVQEPQAYRDESRVSEFGTKHIDPDTGLIYFKYDFGYEFGVILPGEAKKLEKKKEVNGDRTTDIPIPVIHEKSGTSCKSEISSTKTNGHIQTPQEKSLQEEPPQTTGKTLSTEAPEEDHTSPQPSLQSDISETDPITRPGGVGGRDSASRMRGAGRSTSASHVVQRGQRTSERARLPDSVQKRCL